MWHHASITANIVWDDVLWHAVAVWVDEGTQERISLERSGRVPLPPDGGPVEALAAVTAAMRRETDPSTPWRLRA